MYVHVVGGGGGGSPSFGVDGGLGVLLTLAGVPVRKGSKVLEPILEHRVAEIMMPDGRAKTPYLLTD